MGQLTVLQNNLAEQFVATRNAGLAYRRVYNPPAHLTSAELWSRANQALKSPGVQARIEELQQQALINVLISAQDIIQDWVDIVSADPNELIRHVRINCRYCRGIDHHYQWVEADLLEAQTRALENPTLPMPDHFGGIGFNGTLPPVEDCPRCFGVGVGEVVVADTTQLSGSARKLFRGIKVTKNGIEVLMANQDEARKQLAECMGLLKGDGFRPPPPPDLLAAQRVADALTPQDAEREYRKMITGIK